MKKQVQSLQKFFYAQQFPLDFLPMEGNEQYQGIIRGITCEETLLSLAKDVELQPQVAHITNDNKVLSLKPIGGFFSREDGDKMIADGCKLIDESNENFNLPLLEGQTAFLDENGVFDLTLDFPETMIPFDSKSRYEIVIPVPVSNYTFERSVPENTFLLS